MKKQLSYIQNLRSDILNSKEEAINKFDEIISQLEINEKLDSVELITRYRDNNTNEIISLMAILAYDKENNKIDKTIVNNDYQYITREEFEKTINELKNQNNNNTENDDSTNNDDNNVEESNVIIEQIIIENKTNGIITVSNENGLSYGRINENEKLIIDVKDNENYYYNYYINLFNATFNTNDNELCDDCFVSVEVIGENVNNLYCGGNYTSNYTNNNNKIIFKPSFINSFYGHIADNSNVYINLSYFPNLLPNDEKDEYGSGYEIYNDYWIHCEYDINNISQPTTLIGNNTSIIDYKDCTNYSYSLSFSIDSIYKMKVDGEELEKPTYNHKFDTFGKHTADFLMKDTTKIYSVMFNKCKNLTKIIIPFCVNEIGYYSFANLENLKYVQINNKELPIINYNAFSGITNDNGIVKIYPTIDKDDIIGEANYCKKQNEIIKKYYTKLPITWNVEYI